MGLLGVLALLVAGWFWLRASGLIRWSLGKKGGEDKMASEEDGVAGEATGAATGLPAEDAGREAPCYPDLRAACALAVLAWLLSLCVTPMHFASGLLGAALAGLTCARRAPEGMEALRLPSAGATLIRIGGVAVVVALAIFFTRQQLTLTGTQAAVASAQDDLTLMESSAKKVPGHSLVQRYILDDRLRLSATPEQLSETLQQVADAPAYLTGYAPNNTQFAQLALDALQARETTASPTALAPIEALLQQAATDAPVTPALLGERLHAAKLSGDVQAIKQATSEAQKPRFKGRSAVDLYSPLKTYLLP
jgi:hypothetical protein